MGSMGLVAAARAAYAVTKDPADPQRRLFLPLKNNIGKDTTGYAFRVESAATGDGIETSRIVWEQDPVTTTAEEAMTSAGATDDRTDIDDAKNFLNNFTCPWAGILKTDSSRGGGRWLFVDDNQAGKKGARN